MATRDETETEMKYCPFCKKQTPHKVVDPCVNKEGTGRDLRCTKCGSSRLGEIQGFDAALM
jgi:transcription elongation factor Elf1